MQYAKPEVNCLVNAATAIQSGSKHENASSDAVAPYTTISAYEADE